MSAEDEAALKTVRAWNEALDRHDLAKLGELYAGTVRYYLQARSKASVLASKRAAFAKRPGFRQELIGEISLTRRDGRVRASFVKKTGPPDDFLVIFATLVLTPSADGFLVVEEADEKTTPLALGIHPGCHARAAEVAIGLPEVQHAIAEATKEADRSDGGARFGTIHPNDDGDGRITAAMGIHTDERFDARFQYSFDRKGRLTVTANGRELDIPPEALQLVRDACRH